MLRAVLGALALVVVSGPAWAGCSNYTDGSLQAEPPEVVICYKGLCGQTQIDAVCASAHSALIELANGWRADYDDEVLSVRYQGGAVPDPEAVACHYLDGQSPCDVFNQAAYSRRP